MGCEPGREKDHKAWERLGHLLRWTRESRSWECWTHEPCTTIVNGALLPAPATKPSASKPTLT